MDNFFTNLFITLFVPTAIGIVSYKKDQIENCFLIFKMWLGNKFDTAEPVNSKVIKINFRYNGKKYTTFVPKNRLLSSSMSNMIIKLGEEDINMLPGVGFMVSPYQLDQDVTVVQDDKEITFKKNITEIVDLNF
jgi:hypothetical protein